MIRVIWVCTANFDEHPRDGIAAVYRARAAREEQRSAPVRLPALYEFRFNIRARGQEELDERSFREVGGEEQRSWSVRLFFRAVFF